MAKNKKQKFYDDGHSFTNMNVEGMPGYRSEKSKQKEAEIKNLNLTKYEQKAIIKAAIKAYFPMFGCMLLGMLVAFLLLLLWMYSVK